MSAPDTSITLIRLDRLRTDLVELAFTLDRQGRLDAADVALTTSTRIAELCDELTTAPATLAAAHSIISR